MLKVLIVDDEPFIRQGLQILIDWREYGYEIKGEASNGQEALNLLKQESFDLVIADIKMPELNGLELIRAIREQKISKAKIIILSGYYDFEYAQKAIRYNADDYLLKPIQKDQLIKTLERLKVKLQANKENEKSRKETEKIIFDRHLLSLIWGKYSEADLEYVEPFLSTTTDLRYIHLELDQQDERMLSLTVEEKRGMLKRLYGYLEGKIEGGEYHVVMDAKGYEDCYDVGVIYGSSFLRELDEKEFFSELAQDLNRTMHVKVLIFIGQKVDELEKISVSFQSTMVAETFYNFVEDKNIAFYEEAMDSSSGAYAAEKENMDALISAVERNHMEDIEKYVDIIYEDFRIHNAMPRMIGLNMDYILYCLIHLAKELDPDMDQEEVLQYIRQWAFDKSGMSGSRHYFKKFVYEFAGYLGQLRQNASRGVLNYVEKDIEECYMENLSLKSLSEKYYINSAYLGQIFKKKFGVSFKDYLNNYRIERATELLIRTDEKIYMIAEKVGYNNLDYFINKFVSIKGKTPLQYRKQFLNNIK